ncbi:MAG: hypothetical protein GEU79_11160 [Acidimicrobiia bacterium]|nr:hypothetical protein [Acidimicrobiia bacterium]
MSEGWLVDAVEGVLSRNRQQGHAEWCGLDYDFVCPSSETYPFQWFWDSCFHAIALAHVDVERAESELTSLVANQHDDGFISHITFWQRERYEESVANYAIALRNRWLTDEMQPPLLAEAIEAVTSRGPGDEFLREILPSAVRFYDWLDRVRDPDGDGLVAVVHPDETGLDHSPKFQEYLGASSLGDWTDAWYRLASRYDEVDRVTEAIFDLDAFVVEDVMVNTIYIENLRVLASQLERTGDESSAHRFRSRADRAMASLLDKCWDPERGLFLDLSGSDENWLSTNTVSSLFPIVLADLDETTADRLIAHLTNKEEYWTEYPVPSVAINEVGFSPDQLPGNPVWRGPTWLNANWYLARGLRRHGRHDLADTIRDRSLDLIREHGFREYHNPFDGTPGGAPDFSWSAIAIDM